jgi:hypothetical protein
MFARGSRTVSISRGGSGKGEGGGPTRLCAPRPGPPARRNAAVRPSVRPSVLLRPIEFSINNVSGKTPEKNQGACTPRESSPIAPYRPTCRSTSSPRARGLMLVSQARGLVLGETEMERGTRLAHMQHAHIVIEKRHIRSMIAFPFELSGAQID